MLLIIAIAVAAGCLAVGLLTGQAVLCWVALAVSLVAVLYFGFLVLRQRRGGAPETTAESSATSELSERAEPDATTERAAEPAVAIGAAGDDVPKKVEVAHPAERESAGEGNPAPMGGGHDVVEWVKVARGRRRFHLGSCELLDGKTADEIGLEEAQEEGFTACTKCIPDLAVVTAPTSDAR